MACAASTISGAPCPMRAAPDGYCAVHHDPETRERLQARADEHDSARSVAAATVDIPASRPDWDEYFLDIATVVARRADCTRAHHGAVVVDGQHRIVSTGYNGSPAGMPGCLSAGACPRGQLTAEQLGHLAGGYDDPQSPGFCISVHAEANALLYAGRGRAAGATIYVTGKPCHGCEKLIRASGIARIVYPGVVELTGFRG